MSEASKPTMCPYCSYLARPCSTHVVVFEIRPLVVKDPLLPHLGYLRDRVNSCGDVEAKMAELETQGYFVTAIEEEH